MRTGLKTILSPSLPDLHFPSDLPIVAKKDEIIAAIALNSVVIITGETGSGKTTQLPKMCLAAGQGRHGLIGCTQPRRVAATSVAMRVAEELGPWGSEIVGYKIRFRNRTRPGTRIKFMTDGILLAETQGDPALRAYDTIIIDEAHERGLNIDFLLGILKRLLAKRADLKVLITSATIDTEKFSRAFDNAPVIEVSGRTYQVDVLYRPLDPELEEKGEVTYIDWVVSSIAELPGSGDILAFLPTERDIMETMEALTLQGLANTAILPLFGRLTYAELNRIFQPDRRRKIVVATNIAETSITVPGIRYVVDTGLARIPVYNPRTRIYSLPISPISRSSADQRKGRCGRTGPGICVRLYTEEDYDSRPLFTVPEIMRANLAAVILKMIALNLGDPAVFPFVDPPSSRAIRDGYTILAELSAIDVEKRLTSAGRIMAKLPLDPTISRIIIEARTNNALREMTIIAAALGVQDPRERPAGKEEEADGMHSRFVDPASDFLTMLKIWDSYHSTWEALKGQGKMRKFCRTHFLSFNRMREWRDIHEQIVATLEEVGGFVMNRVPADYDAIHKAILSGYLRNIAVKQENSIYLGAQGKKMMIFPGSGLFKRSPAWIVTAECVATTRLYARIVAAIRPEWIEPLARDLCRSSYSDPHWEKRRGQVKAIEKVTLFGLVIVPARTVNYGRINQQEARDIFIRSALIEGELKGKYGFLEHNRELIDHLADLENRARCRNILVDDHALFGFYDQRLGDVWDQASLDRMLKERGGDEQLRMQEEDIARYQPAHDTIQQYPDSLKVGEIVLPLSYTFDPAAEDDGVTITIPLELVGKQSPDLFEWLVPGLLEDKVIFLLKGLPKAVRKALVPISETVRRIWSDLPMYEGSLYTALQGAIFKHFQVRVPVDQWPIDSLPTYLKMRFQVIDQAGNEILITRDVAQLGSLSPVGGEDERLISLRAKWERRGLVSWDFEDLPSNILLPQTPYRLPGYAYPGLAIDGDGCVAVRLFHNEEERARSCCEGFFRLLCIAFRNEIKILKKDIILDKKQWPLYEGLGDFKKVNEGLLNFILEEIFGTREETLPDRARFQARIDSLKGGRISSLAMQIMPKIIEVLQERRGILDLLSKCEGSGSETLYTGFRLELERLLPGNFFKTMTVSHLDKVHRYLKALKIRLERAYLSPAKDEAKAAQVLPYEQRLEKIQGMRIFSPKKARLVSEYAEMLEEYKISLFAQELKTAFPVSAKRLEKKWQEIEGCF